MQRPIVVIDDSPTIRKILEVTLRRAGYPVTTFPDGVLALKTLLNEPVEPIPSLFILDIDLPQMNGFEIARYLKKKPVLSEVPLLFISRHCGVVQRLKARLLGAHSFLTKPFTTTCITATVSTLFQEIHNDEQTNSGPIVH
ncbi:chemosensory pili system protein ChpA (sensor histidine kinase/response regulator) [Thermosporothrix hazakensis]|jgi:DNA-binding response OmpR family regulator|uniref:Chemosensory pili system protein ChpA (Sensor histidine kinase/response regulator) n=2 Tax=Thermosporothrix TaxID=768650 RepID=A0A326UBT0_THEHA|nr:response regulator [Thermosporothrix hazakensis]PZW31142.1 chemosensory pili system protein ChpA (sensor histidine kinase/response regulator) [Thermosporothrix hazakensis]BBH86636.1 hypothetical protein KTC_13870 [Thermosporothrix sp. COM3]GCE50946.1 hypothetical protein KTH_58150 [Thermosporothrix hazakensis]